MAFKSNESALFKHKKVFCNCHTTSQRTLTYFVRETDLLFDWLGFSCFAYVELDGNLEVWSNPNKSTGGQPYSDTSLMK